MTSFSKSELYHNRSTKPDKATWTVLIGKYHTSNIWQGIGQAINIFIPFFLLWYLMYLSLDYSYWMTLSGRGAC